MDSKPTACKLTGVAIAFTDSRKGIPRERGEDGRSRRPSGSHEGDKSESRDDFELHDDCLFVILNTGDCLNEDSAKIIAIFILPDI